MNEKNSQSIILEWLAAILMFLQLEPFYIWSLHPYKPYYTLPLMLIFAFKSRIKRITIYDILFLLLAILASICTGSNIIGITMTAMLVFLFLCDRQFLIDAFLKFRTIYVVLIALSMIVWLLVSVGVNVPHRDIPPLNPLKAYTYMAYPFFVRVNMLSLSYDSLGYSLRFMGLFDEPGVVGTISLMLLFIGKFDLKKFYNIVLLLSGILSLSLFFYIAAFVFLFYNAIVSNHKILYKVFTIVLMGGLVYYSYLNPITQELIWTRLEWDSSKQSISGDNRSTDELDNYIKSIRGSNAYFWGVRDVSVIDRYSESASLNNAILRYGFVVLFLFFVFYFFFSCHFIERLVMWLTFMVFLYITLYQRPAFFYVHYLFLFNMAVYSCSEQYEQLFINGEEETDIDGEEAECYYDGED